MLMSRSDPNGQILALEIGSQGQIHVYGLANSNKTPQRPCWLLEVEMRCKLASVSSNEQLLLVNW
jgi:hypothetical protein